MNEIPQPQEHDHNQTTPQPEQAVGSGVDASRLVRCSSSPVSGKRTAPCGFPLIGESVKLGDVDRVECGTRKTTYWALKAASGGLVVLQTCLLALSGACWAGPITLLQTINVWGHERKPDARSEFFGIVWWPILRFTRIIHIGFVRFWDFQCLLLWHCRRIGKRVDNVLVLKSQTNEKRMHADPRTQDTNQTLSALYGVACCASSITAHGGDDYEVFFGSMDDFNQHQLENGIRPPAFFAVIPRNLEGFVTYQPQHGNDPNTSEPPRRCELPDDVRDQVQFVQMRTGYAIQ